MGLFKRNYDKPGPGVPKNAPRKKGIPRFVEILGRDFGNLVKANMLYALCLLPAQALLLLAYLSLMGLPLLPLPASTAFLVLAALALLAAFPTGPAHTALTFLVTRMLRDEPGFIWHDFKAEFKKNFRSTLVPGLIYAAIMGAQLLAFLYYTSIQGAGGVAMIAVYLLSVLLFAMAGPYYFVQAAYIDLPSGSLLKNSLLLAVGNAPRSLAGALFGTGLLAVQLLWFPVTVPILLTLGYAVPLLLNQMWVWPVVDKVFAIEKTLRERQAQQLEQEDASLGEDTLSGEENPPEKG